MEIQLPSDIKSLRTVHLLNWNPSEPIAPNPQLLKKLNKTRRKQTASSRNRQNFITGMSIYRMSKEELTLKRLYIEEWHHRIKENVWDE